MWPFGCPFTSLYINFTLENSQSSAFSKKNTTLTFAACNHSFTNKMVFAVVEDDLLVALVRANADWQDLSKSKNASTVFKSVAETMTQHCHCQIDALSIAKKWKEWKEMLDHFVWFRSTPEIVYVESHNLVVASPVYQEAREGNETPLYKRFRLHGMPHYVVLRHLFYEHGMQSIDFDWIFMDLSGGDPKWMGEPSN